MIGLLYYDHMSFDIAQAKEHLRYEDGKFFWKQRPGIRARVRVGDRAGCTDKNTGYRSIRLSGADIYEHHLVWLFFDNDLEEGQVLDHKNGVRDDNRIENLRACSYAENAHNRVSKGAYWRPHAKKWQAMIKIGDRQKSLGYYSTFDEARAAYVKAKTEHHPNFR